MISANDSPKCTVARSPRSAGWHEPCGPDEGRSRGDGDGKGMVKVRRYPHKPGPQEWLEETGFLGREEVLPEIYHSTRLFGPFCTRPESASLPGSSKRWRGLPTADTRIFRAHRHLSSHRPQRMLMFSSFLWFLIHFRSNILSYYFLFYTNKYFLWQS